jgi:hypothetical protein
MSDTSSSIPINILFNNNDNFNNYIYILELYLKDGSFIKFENTSSEKYINIFTFRHNIDYYNIKNYELSILCQKPILIKNEFVSSLSFYIYKDNNIFIEISKNNDNNANCCIYLPCNNSRMFFTPPNY